MTAVTLTYAYGTNEALEAEFGYSCDEPFAVIEFVNGEFSQSFPFTTGAAMQDMIAAVKEDGCEVSRML